MLEITNKSKFLVNRAGETYELTRTDSLGTIDEFSDIGEILSGDFIRVQAERGDLKHQVTLIIDLMDCIAHCLKVHNTRIPNRICH